MGLGRALIVIGLVLVLAGIVITLGVRLPFRIGRLPGDFVFRGKNTVIYFPLMTSIVLSLVLTLVMWMINRR